MALIGEYTPVKCYFGDTAVPLLAAIADVCAKRDPHGGDCYQPMRTDV